MASLKCLACGHDNKVGDESCISCSSSLNLRLCSACEAINANDAQRCHSCGAQFGAEAPAAPVVEGLAREAAAPEKVLPAAWVVGAERAVRRSRRAAAVLWLLPVLGVASSAYYFFGTPHAAPKHAPTPVVEVKAAPVEVKAPRVEVKPAPLPVEQPKTSIEPKRAFVAVRPAPAPAPLAPVAVVPVKEFATPVPGQPRVTHTKAERTQNTPEAVPVRAAVGASAASAAAKVEPAPCAPGTSALGLCQSK